MADQWQPGTVTLAVKADTPPTVDAIVRGPFAIHDAQGFGSPPCYGVTHIPSGRMFLATSTKTEAKRFVGRIYRLLDWTALDLTRGLASQMTREHARKFWAAVDAAHPRVRFG
jgi:hypothetical protein